MYESIVQTRRMYVMLDLKSAMQESEYMTYRKYGLPPP